LSGAGRSDVVIVGHINQSPVAWVAKKLGLIKDYVVVLHGIEAWQRTGWLRRRSMMSAGSIIATTRYTALKSSAVNDIPGGVFKVIPLCAEPIPDEPDPNFRLDGEWPILFVGRLAKTERYKGLDMVMEAVAELRKEGSPIKLHVIGDGDDRTTLESQARKLMLGDQCITLHGRVSGSQLQAAYKDAKLFVMPSAKEGFGIVFLEAMRNSVPCVGGAHGGTPEVFTDGTEGFLVDNGDTQALKDILKTFYGSPTLVNDVGRAAYQRYFTDYRFSQFKSRWTIYLNALSAR